MKTGTILAFASGVALVAGTVIPGIAKDVTTAGQMSTAKTQDVVNTLRSRGAFHTMLEGLEQSFDLDNELKGKGPYTVFAADDKAWHKINQADRDTLFGNKDKLAQVLRYEVIKGKCLDAQALGSASEVQSLQGKLLKVDKKGTELWVNHSKVKTRDIRCTNGIIHIVDAPLMPPLAQ